MLTVCTAEISSKIFWPKGPKIFDNQHLKLKSQLAPRFFSKVKLCTVQSQTFFTTKNVIKHFQNTSSFKKTSAEGSERKLHYTLNAFAAVQQYEE